MGNTTLALVSNSVSEGIAIQEPTMQGNSGECVTYEGVEGRLSDPSLDGPFLSRLCLAVCQVDHFISLGRTVTLPSCSCRPSTSQGHRAVTCGWGTASGRDRVDWAAGRELSLLVKASHETALTHVDAGAEAWHAGGGKVKSLDADLKQLAEWEAEGITDVRDSQLQLVACPTAS